MCLYSRQVLEKAGLEINVKTQRWKVTLRPAIYIRREISSQYWNLHLAFFIPEYSGFFPLVDVVVFLLFRLMSSLDASRDYCLFIQTYSSCLFKYIYRYLDLLLVTIRCQWQESMTLCMNQELWVICWTCVYNLLKTNFIVITNKRISREFLHSISTVSAILSPSVVSWICPL